MQSSLKILYKWKEYSLENNKSSVSFLQVVFCFVLLSYLKIAIIYYGKPGKGRKEDFVFQALDCILRNLGSVLRKLQTSLLHRSYYHSCLLQKYLMQKCETTKGTYITVTGTVKSSHFINQKELTGKI